MASPPIRRFAPRPELRDRVASFDLVEGGPDTVDVLPGTAVVLGLQWRGAVVADGGPLATAGVTGVQEAARRYAYRGDAASVLVRFTPTGAACLGVPVAELTGRSVPLDALLPSGCVAETAERLVAADDDRARVAAVEALLLGARPFRDPLVEAALAAIRAARRGDGPLVAALAADAGISERQLERRFLRVVGVTPKRWAALHRFERAVAGLGRADSLAALAIGAGYYDQAQLTRDVRRFSGKTPSELRREREGTRPAR